jgi:hypothetical protein
LIDEIYYNPHFSSTHVYGECLLSSFGCFNSSSTILKIDDNLDSRELLNQDDILQEFIHLPFVGCEVCLKLYTQDSNDFKTMDNKPHPSNNILRPVDEENETKSISSLIKETNKSLNSLYFLGMLPNYFEDYQLRKYL